MSGRHCAPFLGVLLAIFCGSCGANSHSPRVFQNDATLQESYSTNEFNSLRRIIPNLTLSLAQLPKSAATRVPLWPGYFWPMRENGFNQRLFGERLSPLEKLAWSMRNLGLASEANALQNFYLQKLRAFAPAQPSWAGHCDNVVESSAWYAEPSAPKLIGGVIFYAHEQKAILALDSFLKTHFYSPSIQRVFLGERVSFAPASSALPWGELDGFGRPHNRHYRDANPGLLHLVLTQVLSKTQKLVWLDAVPSDVVLMFGVRAFKVTELSRISSAQELARVRSYNGQASSFYRVRAELTLVDSHRYLTVGQPRELIYPLEYALETNANGHIIGGEWMGQSLKQHPDFLVVQEAHAGRQPSSFLSKWIEAWKSAPTANNAVEIEKAFAKHPDASRGARAVEKVLAPYFKL